MDILAEKEGKTYGAIEISTPGQFVSPYAESLFPCLIWDHDGRFNNEERSQVIRALLKAGCRYAVCGGLNCEVWHDDFDEEYVGLHLDDPKEAADSEFIMTSWHHDESPDDVAFFFVFHTDFENHRFRKYLVLNIGTGDTVKQLADAVKKYALNEKAV